MLGHLCEPELGCEPLLPLWEPLLPLWELVVLGAVECVVVLPLVVLVPLAAVAIAAPPPTAAPVRASTASMVGIRRRISFTSFLSSGRGSPDDAGRR